MPDHVDSVKGILRLFSIWQRNAVAKGEEKQAENYAERILHIQAIVDELEELRRVTKPIPASYGDLSDLPPELMKELAGIKVDDLEQQIFTIVKSGAEEVDLDAILIELFRRFQIIQTRKFLQNKLWRMAQKGVIFSVSGKKGVYSANAPIDFDELLGHDTKEAKPVSDGFDDDDIPF